MATTPDNEQPGFETDVNELPHDKDNGDEHRLEDGPEAQDENASELEEAQKEAAEERKEGGYQ